jgi:hypothetical protein
MATIFNHILNMAVKPKGIKAVIVYPMNALINSQEEEIKKYELNYLKNKGNIFLHNDHLPLDEQIQQYKKATGLSFPITYGKYTGQENSDKRDNMMRNPPDIILTNYMMLELIMTRAPESWMRDSFMDNLKYLVFDELHTYRGRQGADISLLIRRIKGLANNPIITIGTSATMASEGSDDDRKELIATFANKIFGSDLSKSSIINEYLIPTTSASDFPSAVQLRSIVDIGVEISDDTKAFLSHPLVVWLEHCIALNNSSGILERGEPLTLDAISKKLADFAGSDPDKTKDVVLSILLWAESLNKKHEKSNLPFKIHQFISQTNTIYVSLEDKNKRYITLQKGNLFLSKDSDTEKPIYPVLFSRYSGFEFICVRKDFESYKLKPREVDDIPDRLTQEEFKELKPGKEYYASGYLLIPDDDDHIWSDEFDKFIPDSWYKELKSGRKYEDFYKHQIPQKIYFNDSGEFSESEDTTRYDQWGWFISSPLLLDPTAGIIYKSQYGNESTKLMRLGNEGRSTASTIVSLSVVKALKEQKESYKNQKILSFSDNRQDASLQSGHFNDFMSIVRLRSALYQALKEHKEITVSQISSYVVEKLGLKESDYLPDDIAKDDNPDPFNKKILEEYILILLLRDLERGWQYTLPNLEQSGLLEIDYYGLDTILDMVELKSLDLFTLLDISERKEVLLQLLDYFRTSYSIHHPYLLNQSDKVQSDITTR